MNIATFEVSHELLVQALKLPDGATIIDAEPANRLGFIKLKVICDDLKNRYEGEIIPIVCPFITQERKDCGCMELTWNWGEQQ